MSKRTRRPVIGDRLSEGYPLHGFCGQGSLVLLSTGLTEDGRTGAEADFADHAYWVNLNASEATRGWMWHRRVIGW